MTLYPVKRDESQASIQKVLQDIWRPLEVELPLFADDQNTKSYEDLRVKSQQISEKVDALIKLESYVKTIETHYKDVTSELTNAQALMDTRKREVESEEHLIKLVERDIGRMREKQQKLSRQHIELEDRRQSYQTALLKQHARLAELGRENYWLLDEEQEWRLAEEQKADDTFALEKYKAIDDKALQEVRASLQRQEDVVKKLYKSLDDETQATYVAQVALNKSAAYFSALYTEREKLTVSYQAAVEQLESLEYRVTNTQRELEERRLEVDDLKNQDRYLYQEIDEKVKENVNAQHEADAIERDCQITQKTVNQLQANLDSLQGELLVVRGALQNTEKMTLKQTGVRDDLKRQLDARKLGLAHLVTRNETLQDVNGLMDCKQLDLDSRIKNLQVIVQQVEYERDECVHRLEEAQLNLQQAGKTLFDMKDQQSTLRSTISSYQAGIRGLESRISYMENQLYQQRRHIYNADFYIQSLTRRLSHVRGDISAEEQLVLKRNIDVLQQQLGRETQNVKLIKQQTGSVLAEIGRVKRQLEEAKAARARVVDRLNELVLSTQTQTNAVQRATEEHQNALLRLDELQIQRAKILTLLRQRAAVAFGLRNRADQIAQAGSVKQCELYTACQIIQNELRLHMNELHVVKMELKTRKIAAAKLEARCAVVMKRVAAYAAKAQNSTELIDPKAAQAEAIRGFAYRRAELANAREKLQQQRKKLESEVNGLAQALEALQNSNSGVRYLGRPASAAGSEKLKEVKNEAYALDSEILYCITSQKKITTETSTLQAENERLRAEIEQLAENAAGDDRDADFADGDV